MKDQLDNSKDSRLNESFRSREENRLNSKRTYARPRTNSPFPPLKDVTQSKLNQAIRQSGSFHASLRKEMLNSSHIKQSILANGNLDQSMIEDHINNKYIHRNESM